MKSKTLFLTRAAVIAALYVALTCLSDALGLAKGAIQLRISEALCVLPAVSFSAVPGVTIGCLIFNFFFSGNILDIIFGTLATFIGAFFASFFKKYKYLAFIPTVVSNMVIIPFVIAFGTTDGNPASIPPMMLTIGIGEILSCAVLGCILLKALEKHHKMLLG